MKDTTEEQRYGETNKTAIVVPFPVGRNDDLHTKDAAGDLLRGIFVQHYSLLIRFLVSRLGSEMEAQDVAQDAIFRLYKQRARLINEDLRALLFVTARNIATDRLRERKRSLLDRSGLYNGLIDNAEDEASSPERIVAAQQKLQLIRAIILELPSKCQEAFTSYKFDGLEYGEIAARMRVSESMVRKYVIKALAYCAARFEAWEGKE